MEIKFQGDGHPGQDRDSNSPKLNFLARWILSSGLIKKPEQAQGLSLIIATILVTLCIISVLRTFSEEKIDPKYYYDPAADTSNS